jgi:hypothetical protein
LNVIWLTRYFKVCKMKITCLIAALCALVGAAVAAPAPTVLNTQVSVLLRKEVHQLTMYSITSATFVRQALPWLRQPGEGDVMHQLARLQLELLRHSQVR